METKREPTKPTLTETLICGENGLSYCCLFAFFSLYRKTEQIAIRLGVTSRTIRLYKARFRDGEFVCCGKGDCLKPAIKAKKELG